MVYFDEWLAFANLQPDLSCDSFDFDDLNDGNLLIFK